MDVYDMRREVNAANRILRDADNIVNELALNLPGRLRHVNVTTLIALKKELRDYNMHTMEWKNHGEK